MRSSSPIAAAAVLVAAFGLTACSGPSSDIVATPVASSAAPAEPTFVVGAVVDATTAQEIGTTGTQRAYPMVNGAGPAPDGVSRSREEMTAVVNEWLAQQDDPDAYVVIHG
ncbi:hypothetical protein GCM10027058_27400 [Microbacterium neimengense]